MKRLALFLFALGSSLFAQDKIVTKTTYAKAYGETKNAVTVDPAKDLPRYPAVEPKDAIATWQVKKGFKLQLAAHEPQVRDPIAICFDERGRMFVCEMIDYSEMRDVKPHLGRISMLQDKDGDGYFETSQVFADDLPWPTGLIWANGGLYVGATPDIWRFEDKDGDGKAEVREKVFTGFGTGLKILNVQGLMNSFQWGQDNKVHILAGGGNRGVITCLKRPDLKGIELGGKDFWFDPLTHEFGLEGGGAQYGMSFDNYGRKFACSNSDHLQYWVYDDKYANRNPYYQMPPARQSIAVDGGAAEVFRLSPDEPWRIIRTRWRVAGVVKGVVEGGGRVSGYFTGATGTTIYRGDAYGPEFVNNSFSGDAGGQLVHRKIIKPSADGISLVGERPADEHGFEFAASKDTWVRVVNFANAPDGCLHICDMYREVIEHPWSIPDEIKKHIDLNSGNDRGRIYRIVPDALDAAYQSEGSDRSDSSDKKLRRAVKLHAATTEELVKLLSHPNGWHRDTAQRLLFERQDKAAVPMLEKVLSGENALAKLHALGVLDGFGEIKSETLQLTLKDPTEHVRERTIKLAEKYFADKPRDRELYSLLRALRKDPAPRVRFQLAFSAAEFAMPPPPEKRDGDLIPEPGLGALLEGFVEEQNEWVTSAVASAPPAYATENFGLYASGESQYASLLKKWAFITGAAPERPYAYVVVLRSLAQEPISIELIRAFAEGLKRAGKSIEEVDSEHKLTAIFAKAASTAIDQNAGESLRTEAVGIAGLSSSSEATSALLACLGEKQPDVVQTAAIRVLAPNASEAVTAALIGNWAHYGPKAQGVALEALLARDDRAVALLEAKVVKPEAFSAAQVQALIKHKSPKVAAAAKMALASVIPPSREEMAAKFKPAVTAKGDTVKGQVQFMGRCMICHKAGANGFAVGPDLITVKTKGREALLEAILMPHKEVASQFIAYTVNTKDGQTLAGVISNDTASSMTLRMPGGAEKTLQRSEIKGSSSSGQSLMPEGLETGMSVEDMADLLSFIEGL
jgi:putative membrane-bound dehydrogenase-like protein